MSCTNSAAWGQWPSSNPTTQVTAPRKQHPVFLSGVGGYLASMRANSAKLVANHPACAGELVKAQSFCDYQLHGQGVPAAQPGVENMLLSVLLALLAVG